MGLRKIAVFCALATVSAEAFNVTGTAGFKLLGAAGVCDKCALRMAYSLLPSMGLTPVTIS